MSENDTPPHITRIDLVFDALADLAGAIEARRAVRRSSRLGVEETTRKKKAHKHLDVPKPHTIFGR